MKKKNPSIFQNVDPSIVKIESDKDICCFVVQKIKKNGLLSQITLRIANEFLYYLKYRKTKILFYESIDPILLKNDIPVKQIILLKNNLQFAITHDDEKIMTEIFSILKKIFNLVGFHDQFKAIKRIGKGSFAIVYLSQNIITKDTFAIKAMSKNTIKDKKRHLSMLNEIKIMRKYDHINLIKLDSVYETDNSFYFVVELFKGGNLRGMIKESGIMSENNCKIILRSILKGLEHLHNNEIIHRDIKPENILFRSSQIEEKNIAIADFGLATFTYDQPYLFVRCGTPGYVAPEVIQSHNDQINYNKKCDLFSVGITFYYMLFSKIPYIAKDFNELMIVNEECIFDFYKNKLFGGLSPCAKDLLLKLLNKDPIHRISATQALNHEFLKEYSQFETNENDIDVPIPSKNLKIFNTRNFNLEKINPQNYSPVSSPLALLVKNKIEIGRKLSEPENINNYVSFIMITPALNGNINTFKSFNESSNKDKDVSEENFSPLIEKSIFFKKMIESSNSQYSHKTN